MVFQLKIRKSRGDRNIVENVVENYSEEEKYKIRHKHEAMSWGDVPNVNVKSEISWNTAEEWRIWLQRLRQAIKGCLQSNYLANIGVQALMIWWAFADEDEANIFQPLGVPCHVWIVSTTGLGGNSHSSHNLPRPGDLDVAGFEILTEYVHQTITFTQCLGAEYGETTLYLSITLAILVLTCLNQVTIVGINKYFKNSTSC